MSLWEYKHITSGPHGFATSALLESYLNQLGKDEWEIISYQNLPNNALAFNGVARRTTLRDWTLESAAAAAAKLEADKLRAEFAAKFQGNTAAADAAAEQPSTLISERAATEETHRKLRDTERDSDPDAHAGEDLDEWDNYDDDLPNFFEAIKPHLRKNQRGNGQSVGVTFLAKRWEQAEGDMIGALKECGFAIPDKEDSEPEYLEFEGDLYWLNLNNRHELFINTREKPRPVYRVVAAKKLDPSDPAAALLVEEAAAEQAEKAKREAERIAREAEQAARRAEHEARRLAQQAEHEARRVAAQAAREAAQAAQAAARAAAAQAKAAQTEAAPIAPNGTAPSQLNVAEAPVANASEGAAPAASETAQLADPAATPLPQGEELLAAIRPLMRRNRRGPGYSGSTVFLARALKHTEAELVAALAATGLPVPENATDKTIKTTLGAYVYWLNKDPRGAIWINGDEARTPNSDQPAGETSANTSAEVTANSEASPAEATGATPASAEVAVPSPAVTPETAAAAPESASPDSQGTPAAQSAAVDVETVSASETESAPLDAAADQMPSAPNEAGGPTDTVPTPESPVEPETKAPVRKASRQSAGTAALTALRLLLKPNKRGSGVSAETGYLAKSVGQDLQVLLVTLTELGLALPATEEHKPSFVVQADEIYWLNKNPKDGSVWLNAKAAKSAVKKTGGTAKPRIKKPVAEE
ncbi:MAG: hypothetical protein H2172_09495 [Opitutus sp.]|nr:hypothetical protein [Opitutus sp.]MCS6246895.1 hypothetical protein [Opitutus sp.]MCS6275605.1 hypothetical protein [Opitutus sp.]MCS6276589.1 hypothetical protein [Opitutus sp.]MCS6301762.1 hypothetical protein [Opitutus sp.]